MVKVKQVVFLHDNRRKKIGGFTDMTQEEKLDYHRDKRAVYIVRREKENKALEGSGGVYKSNWELVTGQKT